MRKITAFMIPFAVAAASCGAAPGEGVVELGTGALAFETLADEQQLGIIAGPQGGYHFIVHARIQLMSPGDPAEPVTTPATLYKVFREDGTQIDKQNPAYHIAYEDTGDGWFTLPGGRIAQIENEEVPAIYGQRVRIRVEVRDESGRTASDEKWVVAFDHCAVYPMDCEWGKPAP